MIVGGMKAGCVGGMESRALSEGAASCWRRRTCAIALRVLAGEEKEVAEGDAMVAEVSTQGS